eukprot:maker-scaffold_39-snap-gene-2.80-mRNA-1 protein AED:0.01 eAED:0.01 QI:252/0.66/0.75/1/1/1/4/1417/83
MKLEKVTDLEYIKSLNNSCLPFSYSHKFYKRFASLNDSLIEGGFEVKVKGKKVGCILLDKRKDLNGIYFVLSQNFKAVGLANV